MNKNNAKISAIYWILFGLYNIVVFVIAGFEGHGGSFWLSYAFTLIAFAILLGTYSLMQTKGMKAKDWLFGLPMVRYCVIYLTAQLLLSVLFMLLDPVVGWAWAFVPQLVVAAFSVIMIIMCFISKETIEQTHHQVERKTGLMLRLRVLADGLAGKCTDPVVKNACAKLAEAIRYSDPVSNDSLEVCEQKLAYTVGAIDAAIQAGELEKANTLCMEATMQLEERNRLCKLSKHNS